MLRRCSGGRAALVGAILLVALAAPRTATAEPAADDAAATEHPEWLRAVIEESIALSAGAVWYWLTPTRQLADWDFPSWEQRVTFEAWRFDNNSFATNYLWHAFGGTEFHLAGRSNHLSLAASAGLGFATSFIWEYLLEFREKVSVNDVLYTTGSGVAVGEFGHWLGVYLTSSPRPNHPLRLLAAWTLGHRTAFHQATSHEPGPDPDAPTDALGYSPDIWHRFSIAVGGVQGTGSGSRADHDRRTVAPQVRAEADLAALPGLLSKGRWRRSFRDGNLTRLRYRGTFDGEDVDTDFTVDTALVGHWAQDIGEDGLGRATWFGAGIAMLFRRDRFGQFSDRLGLLHLGNLAVEQRVLAEGLRLTAGLRLHADFAGIESAAYPAWKREHPDAVEKTILRREGYYYGWGLSGRLFLELELTGLSLGASVFIGRYASQEGLDRSQESVTFDVAGTDQVDDEEAWLRLGPAWSVLFLEGRWLRQHRVSRLGGHQAQQTLDRLSLSVGAVF